MLNEKGALERIQVMAAAHVYDLQDRIDQMIEKSTAGDQKYLSELSIARTMCDELRDVYNHAYILENYIEMNIVGKAPNDEK